MTSNVAEVRTPKPRVAIVTGVLAAAALAVMGFLLIGLPWLAGPPSWTTPASLLAWIPLTLVIGVMPLFVGLVVVGDITDLLTRKHAHGKDSPELMSPIVLFTMIGAALGWLLGGESWGIGAGILVGMVSGVAVGFGLDAVQEKLVSVGWLHYEREGCCERTRTNRIEALDPVVRDAADPLRQASAFMGSMAAKDSLLDALGRQRGRATIVRDDIEPACDFRIRVGCPVPCEQRHHATDGDPSLDMDEHHRLYHSLYGVPPTLSSIENAIFSNLPLADVAAWPERFVGAIQPGSDLSAVSDRWMLWLLADEDSPLDPVRSEFEDLSSLLRKRLAGDALDADEWRSIAGFSESQSWMLLETQRAGSAVARYGVATSELDAARDIGIAVAQAGQLAAHLQRCAIAAEEDQSAAESRNPVAGSIMLIRRSFGKPDWDPGHAWKQMGDRLLDELGSAQQ